MDYEAVRQQILENIKNDKSLQIAVQKLNQKIKNKTAEYKDVAELADVLSDVTSRELEANSPSDEELEEFANEVLAPVYKQMQITTLAAAKIAQQIYNNKAGIGLKPADVKPDESRIAHIVARYREAPLFDDVSFLLENYVSSNISKGAVTDTIRENAWNMRNAGFETYVTRDDGTGCCDWCASKVGTYSLNDIPRDFWQVHKGCSCEFYYKSRKTSSKVFFSTDESGNITRQSK